MKILRGIMIAGLGGFFGTLFALCVLLMLAGIAFGQESIATRPAELGEQNRSLNYPLDPYHVSGVGYEDEELHIRIDALESRVRWEETRECRERNATLLYMLKHIAKRIAEKPSDGYIYEDSIQAIHDSWCRG